MANTRKPLLKPGALPADDEALIRLTQVLDVFPVGASTWWAGIASGKYPKPIKLGPKTAAWRVGSIRALLSAAGDDSAA
jgi:predicted DNA-binding transcriptional regulator AlpA